jgi:regulator of replication initiation timing
MTFQATGGLSADRGRIRTVNEQSLERVNAFLAAVAARTERGQLLEATPAELGRELGFPDPLSIARAVRALVARQRLEPAGGSYRLLDPTPVAAGERETVERRGRRTSRRGEDASQAKRGGLAYSDLGRATVDRLVELGQEVSQLRAQLKTAREEARENRELRVEAERRAQTLSERARELEHRVEMAESNLRTLLASARATGMHPDQRLADSEMEAILGVLKGNGEESADGSAVSEGAEQA